MRDVRVYHPEIRVGRLILSPEESHHVRDVLRRRPGNTLHLFDGQGGSAAATVVRIARESVEVEAGEVVRCAFDSGVRLTLATAVPKGPRQTYLIEKCTELGVWAFWPTSFERSVVHPKETAVNKWRRTAIEACKQCGRPWLPQIDQPRTFLETVDNVGCFDVAVVTDTQNPCGSLAAALADATASFGPDVAPGAPVNALVWIGPEGGLTGDEIATASAAGAVGASLGTSALRVETAAVAVASWVALSDRR